MAIRPISVHVTFVALLISLCFIGAVKAMNSVPRLIWNSITGRKSAPVTALHSVVPNQTKSIFVAPPVSPLWLENADSETLKKCFKVGQLPKKSCFERFIPPKYIGDHPFGVRIVSLLRILRKHINPKPQLITNSLMVIKWFVMMEPPSGFAQWLREQPTTIVFVKKIHENDWAYFYPSEYSTFENDLEIMKADPLARDENAHPTTTHPLVLASMGEPPSQPDLPGSLPPPSPRRMTNYDGEEPERVRRGVFGGVSLEEFLRIAEESREMALEARRAGGENVDGPKIPLHRRLFHGMPYKEWFRHLEEVRQEMANKYKYRS